MEILPIKVLTEEDAPVFGKLCVLLGQLSRLNFPVSPGICVTPPGLHLKTTLEHYDFSSKEVFEQTLTLVKKELQKTPVPKSLLAETKGCKRFWVLGRELKQVKEVWLHLLESWIAQIKQRIWKDGFYLGITEGLEPQVINFVSKVESSGSAFYDSLSDDVAINVKGSKIHPNDRKKIMELVLAADKKLLIPHEYEWIIDRGVKLSAVYPGTSCIDPYPDSYPKGVYLAHPKGVQAQEAKCTVKVFVDLSEGLVIEHGADGIFLASEKIYNPEKPIDSLDRLILKIVETAITFPDKPVIFKLADVSEGMGGIRGSLRLLHQKSLIEPLMDSVTFAINKKGLKNIHLCLPFIRNSRELLQLKRELAVKGLSRSKLKHWMEIAVPENIINLEDYLNAGIDGVVLNLDELLAHLTGFDLKKEELGFYKKEFEALVKFLEDPFKVLHKAKLPILACGSLTLEHEILDFLVEKGVFGIVVKKYESHSIKDLLHNMEKRVILRRSG